MSTLIEAIGPLAFWVLALGVAPGLLLVTLMVIVGRVTDRVASKTEASTGTS